MSMRMRFVALVALTLVVTVVWYVAAFKPSRTKLSEVRADVKRTQDEVAALTAKLQHLQDLKANEEELRKEFAKLKDALPVEPAVSDFILDVQQAADQAGIAFLSIAPALPAATAGSAPAAAASGAATAPSSGASPSPSQAETAESTATAPTTTQVAPGVHGIAVSLTADGSFFAIEEFVAKMEKLERALRVNTFSLSGAGGDTAATGAAAPAAGVSGSPKVSLTIALQIFMGGPAATASTAPAAPAASTTGTGS